jgi:hypothetical protein
VHTECGHGDWLEEAPGEVVQQFPLAAVLD